ncbi:uncharacterized protein LOC141907505 [Tubulanus polymorphus]|uniref:uncharacterized protein LOC141907505 n=1 Tax=Tubulanus polymorphus TaxID=672921 RepID=UPI003DA56BB2
MAFDLCAKVLLVVFNIIWVILGLVLLGLGIAFHFAVHTILLNFLKTLPLNSLNAIPADLPIDKIISSIGQADQLKSFATQLAIPLIVVGAIFFGLGFFGCCGAYCKNKICLLIYVILVSVILGAQIIAAIVIAAKKNEVRTKVQTEMKGVINKVFGGVNGTTPESQLLNIGMIFGECCGLTNYSDFYTAPKWNRTFIGGVGPFDVSNQISNDFTQEIPAACCKRTNLTWPASSRLSDFVLDNINDINCLETPDTTNSNYEMPCWTKLEDLIKNNQAWIIVVFILGVIFQALLIACAVMLYRSD